jgi:nickel transport protein
MMKTIGTKLIGFWVLCALAVLFLTPYAAVAHRVNVFAWVEGDTVHVESKFAGGREVNRGRVTVLDPQGRELLTGTTDEKGEYSFKAPAKTDLRIVLAAGEGHQGSWTIKAEELAGAFPDATAILRESGQNLPEPEVSDGRGTGAPGTGVDAAELESMIESALERKLKPIVRMLAEARQSGPGFRDIVGGIGYILGLVGIAAYVHSRRK